MIEVQGGTALSQWIEICQPAVSSVRGMAEQLELAPLCAALDSLLAALGVAQRAGGAISGEVRDGLMAAYQPLCELVPGALELEGELVRREPVIVQALLRQVPGVEKLAIDRLVAANLIGISALAGARPDELAAVTGLDLDLATRVIERFQSYGAQAGLVASPDPAAEHRALARLLETLQEQSREYDDAASQWSADAKERKRHARQERARTLLRIHVSFARLGEVERLVELDKLSFRRKAEYVDRFLQEVRASAGILPSGPGPAGTV
jgi:hypothetical protein